jgi:hypothetical protein
LVDSGIGVAAISISRRPYANPAEGLAFWSLDHLTRQYSIFEERFVLMMQSNCGLGCGPG